MDIASVGALMVSLATAAGLIVAKIREQRRIDRQSEVEVTRAEVKVTRERTEAEREDDETIIHQWRQFAQSQKAQHNVDVKRLEGTIQKQQVQIDTISGKERDCQIRQTEQAVEIKHMQTAAKERDAKLAEQDAQISLQNGEIAQLHRKLDELTRKVESSPAMQKGES